MQGALAWAGRAFWAPATEGLIRVKERAQRRGETARDTAPWKEPAVHTRIVYYSRTGTTRLLAEALVASNACIMGPATAAAIAAGQGWRGLVTPGLLIGILGYVIANFLGVAVFEFLG